MIDTHLANFNNGFNPLINSFIDLMLSCILKFRYEGTQHVLCGPVMGEWFGTYGDRTPSETDPRLFIVLLFGTWGPVTQCPFIYFNAALCILSLNLVRISSL